MSPDFFAADSFPTATFELTGAEPYTAPAAGEETEASELKVENPTHTLSGNLTLRGKTLGISFPAKVALDGSKITAVANFNIDRTLWDVSYNSESSIDEIAKDKIISNTVNVGFNLTANKPAEAGS